MPADRISARTASRAARRALAMLCLAVALTGGCSTIEGVASGEAEETAETAPPVPLTDPVAYDFDLDTNVEPAVRALMEKASALRTRADRPPASLASLNARINEDVSRFRDILRSEGYYKGEVTPTVDTSAEPVAVTISVQNGPPFTLAAYDLIYRPTEPVAAVPRTAADLGLEIGQVAAATPLVDAERAIIRRLGQRGYPHATLASRRYVANRETETIRATLGVDTGPFTKFGELRIEGLDDVEEDFVRRVADWKPGMTYDRREIARVRGALVDTRLFSAVSLKRDDAEPPEAVEPVTFIVEEGPPRSVGLGATFSTDEEGFGGQASWEHRNLFGRGERLRLSATASQIIQMAALDFRKPHVLRLDQAITAEGALRREASDAFDELSASGYVGVERAIGDHWMVTLGPAVILSRIEQGGDTDGFLLVGGRASATYEDRDDPLNPTRGVIGSLRAAPYRSVALSETEFLRTEGTLAGYLPVIGDDWLVLAARTRVASILGDDRFNVPASLRFFAGGGGSVRGFAFRTVGPLDDNNDPEGARSVVEINTEARVKIIEEFGVVGFVDGGQGFANQTPKFDEEYLWAAGFGLRYYSPVGPFRFDIGFPLNPRDSDDAFQFYISIGQAF